MGIRGWIGWMNGGTKEEFCHRDGGNNEMTRFVCLIGIFQSLGIYRALRLSYSWL